MIIAGESDSEHAQVFCATSHQLLSLTLKHKRPETSDFPACTVHHDYFPELATSCCLIIHTHTITVKLKGARIVFGKLRN